MEKWSKDGAEMVPLARKKGGATIPRPVAYRDADGKGNMARSRPVQTERGRKMEIDLQGQAGYTAQCESCENVWEVTAAEADREADSPEANWISCPSCHSDRTFALESHWDAE